MDASNTVVFFGLGFMRYSRESDDMGGRLKFMISAPSLVILILNSETVQSRLTAQEGLFFPSKRILLTCTIPTHGPEHWQSSSI